ncbi:MAG: C45 family autoproteolytic acyltransferase/hydrolase [Actinomycetota bacterium]
MSWPVVRAFGGPRERGRAYGEGARDRVHGSIDLYSAVFAHYTGMEWSRVRHRAAAFIEWIEATDEQLLPEIEGIAEGAGVEAEDVLALNVRTEVMFGLDARAARAAAKECTAIAAAPPRSAGARVLVAQNWDWKPPARDTCVLLAMRPHGRPGFVTLVEAGLLAKCGMNEAGVGLAANALTSSRDRGLPGVPFHAILRRMLTSASFDEAVRAVTGSHRASSANYVLGSRDGRVIDLEVAPGGPDMAWRVEGPMVCHANHFLRPDRPFKDLARLEGRDSFDRHVSAERSTDAVEAIDPAAIELALREHADPQRGDGSVCAHGDPSLPPEADYVTVASVVMDLTAGTLRLTEGNPCETPFETHRCEDLLPPAAGP